MLGLMPHGSCFLWDRYLTGLHLGADLIIAIAYCSIPTVMFINRRYASNEARPLLFLFAAFILSCGFGHFIEAWNIWHSHYWWEGSEKLLTALISTYTALELWRRIPNLLGTQKALEESEILAHQDALTGLANRRALDNAINRLSEQSFKTAKNHGLLLLDLDGFKQINDFYGHPTGDQLLKDVANTLECHVRPSQSLVARLGGDEFALLLENCTLDESIQIACRLRNAIAQMPTSKELHHLVRASVGIAQLTHRESVFSAYENADKALYNAKTMGKNLVSWKEEHHTTQFAVV